MRSVNLNFCEEWYRMIISEKLIEGHLQGARKVRKEGSSKELYLDIAERIVRWGSNWVDEKGEIIDPVTREPFSHATPRFCVSAGLLIKQGRCLDLVGKAKRVLDYAIREFPNLRPPRTSFYPRDIALTFMCLKRFLTKAQITEWKKIVSGYDAEVLYDLGGLSSCWSNMAVYAATGEYLLIRCGLRSVENMRFVENALKTQMEAFTSLGMYRDPNYPMTYDLAVRQNLVLLLKAGYDGKYANQLGEFLRRGSLTQLFYQSVSGEMPFGGRSNQFHHTEGMFCTACEYEADRYYKEGNVKLAGVLKRAGRRAAESVKRWVLDSKGVHHIKNMFPIKTMHGCDSYGGVSVYSLLAANLFALSADLCNEKIADVECPSEVGGYVFPIIEDFHRIFAGTSGVSIEIDVNGQKEFDPTGLGRIHIKGYPTEMILSTGIVSHPKYITVVKPARENFAIGPVDIHKNRRWSFANEMPTKVKIKREKVDKDAVVFEVYSTGLYGRVWEKYEIFDDRISVSSRFYAKWSAITVPIIRTDGKAKSKIKIINNRCEVEYRGKKIIILFDKDVKLKLLGMEVPNRNGLYRILRAEGERSDNMTKLSKMRVSFIAG